MEIHDFFPMDEEEYPLSFRGPIVDILFIPKFSLLYENVTLAIIKNTEGYFFLAALAGNKSSLISKICKLPKILGKKAESLMEEIRYGQEFLERRRRKFKEEEEKPDYEYGWEFYMGSDDHWHYDDRPPSLEEFAADDEAYNEALNLDLVERYICFKEILQYFDPVLVEALHIKTVAIKGKANRSPTLVYKIGERSLGHEYSPNIEHFKFLALRARTTI